MTDERQAYLSSKVAHPHDRRVATELEMQLPGELRRALRHRLADIGADAVGEDAVALDQLREGTAIQRRRLLQVEHAAEVVLDAVGEELPQNVIREDRLRLLHQRIQAGILENAEQTLVVPKDEVIVFEEVEREEPQRSVLGVVAQHREKHRDQRGATAQQVLQLHHFVHVVARMVARTRLDALIHVERLPLHPHLRQRCDSFHEDLHRFGGRHLEQRAHRFVRVAAVAHLLLDSQSFLQQHLAAGKRLQGCFCGRVRLCVVSRLELGAQEV